MEKPRKDSPDKPEAEEFDPIREIKRLRQDLAHRLHELQERNTVPSPLADQVKNADAETICFDAPLEKNLDSITRHMRQARKMLSHLQVKAIAQGPATEEFWIDEENSSQPEPVGSERKTLSSNKIQVENQPVRHSCEKIEAEPIAKTPHCGHCCAAPRASSTTKNFVLENLDSLVKKERSASSQSDFLEIANIGLTGLGTILAVIGCLIFVLSSTQGGSLLVLGGSTMLLVGLFGRFCGWFSKKHDKKFA